MFTAVYIPMLRRVGAGGNLEDIGYFAGIFSSLPLGVVDSAECKYQNLSYAKISVGLTEKITANHVTATQLRT